MAIEFRNVNTQKIVRVRHQREAARLDKLPHYERVEAPVARPKKAAGRKATGTKKTSPRTAPAETSD